MANPEHLEMLAQGCEKWNSWRTANTGLVPDLSGADIGGLHLTGAPQGGPYIRHHRRRFSADGTLTGAYLAMFSLQHEHFLGINLKRADLRNANLRGADLSRAHLQEANLSGADLSRAILGGAELTASVLHGTNLLGASLIQASFTEADLLGANLDSASFLYTTFGNTNLADARGLESCNHLGRSFIDFATLSRSGNLPTSFLQGCGLSRIVIDYLPSLLNTPVTHYSCFISYSHADAEFARLLETKLKANGIDCFRDEKQILPGQDIYEEIDRGIQLWDKILLCCSKASLTSWWVDDEIGKAFAKEQALMKERGSKVLALIPLDLDGFLFNGWQNGKASQVRQRLAANFRNWRDRGSELEAEIDRVRQSLEIDALRKPPPTSRL